MPEIKRQKAIAGGFVVALIDATDTGTYINSAINIVPTAFSSPNAVIWTAFTSNANLVEISTANVFYQEYDANEANHNFLLYKYTDGTNIVHDAYVINLLPDPYVFGRKRLTKESTTWYMVIEDMDGTNIVKKALKDKDGNELSDILAGKIAEEQESSIQ